MAGGSLRRADPRGCPERLLILASGTAAAGWLARVLGSHPQGGSSLRLVEPSSGPEACSPDALGCDPDACRALLVVRHPALEAIEARLNSPPGAPPDPPCAALTAWPAWQHRLGSGLKVVPVSALIAAGGSLRLGRICRHLGLPPAPRGWPAAEPPPPPYRHGLPRTQRWRFAGDGVRLGRGRRRQPALAAEALLELLAAAQRTIGRLEDAGCLAPGLQRRWLRISQALQAYATTISASSSASGGPTGFWIDAGDAGASEAGALAVGVIGRVGRTARRCRFEVPIRLESTFLAGACRIGAFTYLVDSFLYATEVGRYCSIGRGCEIGQHDHPIAWLSTHPFQYSSAIGFEAPGFPLNGLLRRSAPPRQRWRRFKADVGYRQPTRIGHDVWLGARVFVKKGVRIGNGAVIGAGAVVTRDIPAYAIAVGNPARVLRYRFDEEKRQRLQALAWWRYAPWSLQDVPFERPGKAIGLLERRRRTGELLPYGWAGGSQGGCCGEAGTPAPSARLQP